MYYDSRVTSKYIYLWLCMSFSHANFFMGERSFMKQGLKGMLASLLIISTTLLGFTNITVRADEGSTTLAINEHLNDWLIDETRNNIYAITEEGNLLVISRDLFQVTRTIPVGSGLSDLELEGDSLWVSVLDTKEIAQINLNELNVERKFSVAEEPYSIEVIEDKLYYAYDQHSEVKAVDITNGGETSLGLDTFYEPDLISVEPDSLYVAESGSTGSHIYKIALATNSIISESTYDDGYGFGLPDRKALIDGNEVFYAGRSIEKDNLTQINGTYNDETVIDSTSGFVFTQKSIFDRDEYRKVMELPFETDFILAPSMEEVYLFNNENMTLYKESYALPSTLTDPAYTTQNQKLTLNQDIDDWVLDEDQGILYAISKGNNTLLTIDVATLEVLDEKSIGSYPSDIDLVDGKLYIANSGSTSINVVDSDGTPTKINTTQNPYRITTDGQDIYYVMEDQFTDIYKVNLFTLSEEVIAEDLQTNAYYFSEPDIELNSLENTLYIGESASSGSDLYAMNVEDLSLKKNDFDNDYGFSYPSRKLIFDSDTLYYAKHSIQASDITNEMKEYTEEIVSTSKDYVVTTNAIYGKAGEDKTTLPFQESNSLINSDGNVFMYVPENQSLYKFNSVEDIENAVPTGFIAVEDVDNNFKLTWDETTADNYHISFKTEEMSDYQTLQEQIINNEFILSEEDIAQWAGQTVTFAVQSVIGAYTSEAVTLEYTFKPEVPVNFQVKKDANNNLVFSWEPVVATYYQISYKTSSMNDFLPINEEQIITSEKVLVEEDYQQWIGEQVTFMVRAFAGDKVSDVATFEFLVEETAPEDNSDEAAQEESPSNPDDTQPSGEPTPTTPSEEESKNDGVVDLKDLNNVNIIRTITTFERIYEYKEEQENLALNLHETLLNEMHQYGNEEFYIESQLGSFKLPINTIEQFATDENSYVQVMIKKVPDEILPNLTQVARENDFEILGQLVDFSIEIVEKGISTKITSYGNQFVERRIPIQDPSDLNDLTVVVLDPVNRSYQPVPTTIEQDENGQYWAIFHRNGNSIYGLVKTSKKNFTDITNHWAKDSIENLASKMVVNGVSENKFEPNRVVTRSEFAAMLSRAFGLLPKDAEIKDMFKDIKSSNWFYENVYAAYEVGLVNGYSNHTFRPNAPISREEMIVMAIRGLELVNGSQSGKFSLLSTFSDSNKVGEFAKKSLSIAIDQNIVKGRTKITLAPKDKVTRAEAVAVIDRLSKKLEF